MFTEYMFYSVPVLGDELGGMAVWSIAVSKFVANRRTGVASRTRWTDLAGTGL